MIIDSDRFPRQASHFDHDPIPGRNLPLHLDPAPTTQRRGFVGVRARELLRDQFSPAMGLDFGCTLGATLSN